MSIKIFLDSSLGDVYEKDFRYNNDYDFGGGNLPIVTTRL